MGHTASSQITIQFAIGYDTESLEITLIYNAYRIYSAFFLEIELCPSDPFFVNKLRHVTVSEIPDKFNMAFCFCKS